jgi:signal transduction histidine kinase
MILEVLTDYDQKIKNRNNITLSYKIQDKDGNIIEADRSRLCQAVNNLLSNAFKFTDEGNITVTVRRILLAAISLLKSWIQEQVYTQTCCRNFLLNSLQNLRLGVLAWGYLFLRV